MVELAGIKGRVRVAAGRVQTDWVELGWIQQRDGKMAAHLRVEGDDFRPPIELGSEIIVDLVREAAR